MTPRVRMVGAGVLLAGWLAVLGYAAATKFRGPVVSRAQVAAATRVVVATVTPGAGGKPNPTATVVQSLKPDGPAEGAAIEVANLPDATGFAGEGAYLLLLTRPNPGVYRVAGLPRSPGYESVPEKLFIYPWLPGVEAQAAALLK